MQPKLLGGDVYCHYRDPLSSLVRSFYHTTSNLFFFFSLSYKKEHQLSVLSQGAPFPTRPVHLACRTTAPSARACRRPGGRTHRKDGRGSRARFGSLGGARCASSSAAHLKAFPVFGSRKGVLECNEHYIHGTHTVAPSSSAHRAAIEEEAKAERTAALLARSLAAAQLLDAPSETPILLEGLRALRSIHPHLPPGGGMRSPAAAAAKRFAAGNRH